MYYKLIGCKVLEREISSVVYNCRNVIDVTLLRQKLHNTPGKLKEALQEEIDLIDENDHRFSNDTIDHDYDAILIGYGLCANAVVGLRSKKYPLVIPRAHDCVTLIMGDKNSYDSYHKNNPGSFFYWPGMLELRGLDEQENYNRKYQMYLDRYDGDEDHVRMIMEIEAELTVNYDGITYIRWETLAFPEYETAAQKLADEKCWEYRNLEGSNILLKKLVDGDWKDDSFLIVHPGHTAEPSYDAGIIKETP